MGSQNALGVLFRPLEHKLGEINKIQTRTARLSLIGWRSMPAPARCRTNFMARMSPPYSPTPRAPGHAKCPSRRWPSTSPGQALRTAHGDRLFATSSNALGNAVRDRGVTRSPHDLRLTAATGMARLGTSRFVLGRVVGDVDSGVTGAQFNHYFCLACCDDDSHVGVRSGKCPRSLIHLSKIKIFSPLSKPKSITSCPNEVRSRGVLKPAAHTLSLKSLP